MKPDDQINNLREGAKAKRNRSISRFRKVFLLTLFLLALPAIWMQVKAQLEAVPFVPTPMEVVDRMLEFAGVNERDIVFDLGSGDGRIVIQAAKKYGAKGVGIELDSRLVEQARSEAKRAGVAHLTEFRQGDALKADLSAATVVTLYMLPSFNQALRPILEQQLMSGARVVAHDYPIDGWQPIRWEEMPLIDTRPQVTPHKHALYLYYVWKPKKK